MARPISHAVELACAAMGLALLATGCFGPNLERELRCSEGLCPSGFTCDETGICRRPGPRPDAAVQSDATAADGPSDAFGTPIRIEAVDEISADPELSSDGLSLFFREGPDGPNTELMVSTRESLSDAWTDSVSVGIGGTQPEFDPRISSDGLTLWFSRGTTESSDIFMATRGLPSGTFGSVKRVTELESDGASFSFSVTADGRAAVFASSRDGDGVDLYATDLVSGDIWGPVRLLDELNTGEFEGNCDISPDGLSIYFDSDRSGRRQLYVATRASVSQPFSPPKTIRELESPDDDQDPTISADGRTLIFSSDRDGGRFLFEATR